jgi:hypothetical protein
VSQPGHQKLNFIILIIVHDLFCGGRVRTPDLTYIMHFPYQLS